MMAKLRQAKTQAERDAILADYAALSQQQSQAARNCTSDQCGQIAADITGGQQALNAAGSELKALSGGGLALNNDRMTIVETQNKDGLSVESQQAFNNAALKRQQSRAGMNLSPNIKAAIDNSDRCADLACTRQQYAQLRQLQDGASGEDAIALTNQLAQLNGKASSMGGCIPGTLCEASAMGGNVIGGTALLGNSARTPGRSMGAGEEVAPASPVGSGGKTAETPRSVPVGDGDLPNAGVSGRNELVDWKHAGADVRQLPNGNWRATGGHDLNDPNLRITPGTTPIENPNGTLTAQVEMRLPDGRWIPKSNNGGEATVLPRDWTPDKINAEVNAAFGSGFNSASTTKFFATSPSGVRFQFVYDSNLKIWRFSPTN